LPQRREVTVGFRAPGRPAPIVEKLVLRPCGRLRVLMSDVSAVTENDAVQACQLLVEQAAGIVHDHQSADIELIFENP
jgi:hypothetical protein